MPYFLTSTANPSSPNSWVNMETESVVSVNSDYDRLFRLTSYRPLNQPHVSSPESAHAATLGRLPHISLNRNLNQLNLGLAPRASSSLSQPPPTSGLYSPGCGKLPLTATAWRAPRQAKEDGQAVDSFNDLHDIEWSPADPSRPAAKVERCGPWRWAAAALSLAAFLSPLAMLILPQTSLMGLRESQKRCEVDCSGLLAGLAFKLAILLVGSWALFARPSKATLPRLHLYRATVATLLSLFIFTFWLFYAVRVVYEHHRRIKYEQVVHFASSMVDTLIAVHYLAVILMEMKHASPRYSIKILRSPDGEAKSYTIGDMSIQSAAAWVLEKYHTDFPMCHLTAEEGTTTYNFFEPADLASNYARMSSPNGRAQHSDYERKLRRRREKLVATAESAFAHLGRLAHQSSAKGSMMSANEAAKTIFATIAKPLLKFLRTTHQQSRHSMEEILGHLENCLSHRMSARAFLERYTSPAIPIWKDEESQAWSVMCDTLLSRHLTPGTTFQLRQGEVSLLCQIHRMPHFLVYEQGQGSKYLYFYKTFSESPV